MDPSTYDAHLARLKAGEMVVIKGRSALNKEQLHFAIKASGDTVPGDTTPLPSTPENVLEAGLEAKSLGQMQELAESLGLIVTGEEDKDALAESIRAIHLEMQEKP